MSVHIDDWIPQKDEVAWIDPNGQVHLVDHYEHLNFFKDHPDMGEAYNELQRALEGNQDEIDQAMFDLEPGEHPAMHRFAFMDDEDRSQLYWEAYSKGWVRLGVHTHNYRKERKFHLEFYGVEEWLLKYKKVWKELGDVLDADVLLFHITETSDSRSYSVFEAKAKIRRQRGKGWKYKK